MVVKKFLRQKHQLHQLVLLYVRGKIKSVTYVEEVAAADRFELSNAGFKVPCLNHLAKRLCSEAVLNKRTKFQYLLLTTLFKIASYLLRATVITVSLLAYLHELIGSGGRIRTYLDEIQSLTPHHSATPLCVWS